MDFGEILERWEKQQEEKKLESLEKKPIIQVSHKKANAPSKENKIVKPQQKTLEQIQNEKKQKFENMMNDWLGRYGIINKDAEAEEFKEKSRMQNRTYLRNMSPEARIDLHGLTRDEAWTKLDGFVNDCIRKGLKKILIIHGKGNHNKGSDPVLGATVKTFIEQNKHLGTSGHPERYMGGTGATWVIIK